LRPYQQGACSTNPDKQTIVIRLSSHSISKCSKPVVYVNRNDIAKAVAAGANRGICQTKASSTLTVNNTLRNMTSSIIAQTNTVLPHSGTPKHLADLPTELVHAIAGFLWRNIDHTNWYDPLEAHYLAYGRQRKYMRRDVLSLSACSKQLRRTFFYDDLIKEVTASLDTEELLALAALPEDVRSCVQ
jgi:hypothetical protein